MILKMSDLSDFLAKRRSAVSLTLEDPGPSEQMVREMIAIASRIPDHGKLAPWRFEQWPMAVRRELHGDLLQLLQTLPLEDKPKKEQATNKILHAPCVVAVISKAQPHPKIPEWEQQLSAGAACYNLLLAANAFGFEAQWLTAWYVYSNEARGILKLGEHERIAGIIHIGSTSVAKTERDRPALDEIYSIRES